jgi:hypothetical protein
MNMPRLRGHWRTSSMISSVRLDGSTACMTIEGTTDTAVFQAYVREILCAGLRAGDIVVMDNLGAHKNGPERRPHHRGRCRRAFPAGLLPGSQPH